MRSNVVNLGDVKIPLTLVALPEDTGAKGSVLSALDVNYRLTEKLCLFIFF